MHLANTLIKRLACSGLTVFYLALPMASSAETDSKPKPHHTAVTANQFAASLLKLSEHLIQQHEVISTQRLGGYGGVTNDLGFYKQIKTINKKTGKPISIVQWETDQPDKLHSIDVFVYDDKGRVLRDYSATYLPVDNRAPYQTLINIHSHKNDLISFRQFDALDNVLYEQCEGKHEGKTVGIVYDYFEMPDTIEEIKDQALRRAYRACFNTPATSAAPYTDPLVEIKKTDQ